MVVALLTASLGVVAPASASASLPDYHVRLRIPPVALALRTAADVFVVAASGPSAVSISYKMIGAPAGSETLPKRVGAPMESVT